MGDVIDKLEQNITVEDARDYLKIICQKDDGGNLFLSLNYGVSVLRKYEKKPDQFSLHLTVFVSGLRSKYDSFFHMLAAIIKYYHKNGKVQSGTCWIKLLGLEIEYESGENLPFQTIGLLREIGLAGKAWSKVSQRGQVIPNEFYLEGAHLPVTTFCQRTSKRNYSRSLLQNKRLAYIHINYLVVKPKDADNEVWLHSNLTV